MIESSGWSPGVSVIRCDSLRTTLAVSSENGVGGFRVSGDAVLIEDRTVKEEVAKTISWFESCLQSPTNPEYILYRLDPILMYYEDPDTKKKYTVEI